MGVSLIGAYASAMLFGITTHQAFRYFRMFSRDKFVIKRLVFALWCLTVASTILVMHQSYHYLVSRRLQLNFLVRTVWSVKLLFLLSGIPATVIRIFLAHRLHIIYKRKLWISAPPGILGFLGLGFCIVTTAMAYHDDRLLVFSSLTERYYDTTLALATISDIVTAVWLSIYLTRNQKNVPEFGELGVSDDFVRGECGLASQCIVGGGVTLRTVHVV